MDENPYTSPEAGPEQESDSRGCFWASWWIVVLLVLTLPFWLLPIVRIVPRILP